MDLERGTTTRMSLTNFTKKFSKYTILYSLDGYVHSFAARP